MVHHRFDYQGHFAGWIEAIRAEGRYRSFAQLERIAGRFPRAILTANDGQKKEVTIWCSNDYLAMGQHPAVIEAAEGALRRCGTGAGGTRNISGTTRYHVELEHIVAGLQQKQAALIFSSGYVANEGTLTTLGKLLPDCAIFSDANNHASMIHGITASRAERFIFRHNDAEHLAELLRQIPLSRPKIVAFESVYSMDGNFGNLEALLDVAEEYGALSYLDEVHAVGLYGASGAGVAEARGLLDRVDLIEGTFGKAYGAMGGFITGPDAIVDAVRSAAPGFIFTTSLPPAILAAAQAAVRHLAQSDVERTRMQANVARLKGALRAAKIDFPDGGSHIVPLIVGDAAHCRRLTNLLLERFQIYVQPINYPTVPKGTERLRLTASAAHSEADIDDLVKALQSLVAEGLVTFKQKAEGS
ncbi:MAG: 5-aminolevulinate synthase [Pseudomonadota bacterium]